MRYRTSRERQERTARLTRRCGVVALMVLASVACFRGFQRASRYKSVIYEYERQTHGAVSASDTSRITGIVGRPDKEYYQLRKRPKYPYFWGEYK